MPRSEFNTVLMDAQAAFFETHDSNIITALTIKSKDSAIFQKHFSIPADWTGPQFQTLIQTFNTLTDKRKIQFAKSSQNFFASGLHTSANEIVVFGSSSGAGVRQAFVSVYNQNLDNIYQSEFTFSHESEIYAATFHQGKLLVAGSTGSVQVETGSIVEPSDSFISLISSSGESTLLTQFGTVRHDRITSLLSVQNKLIVGGFEDGPITHTADHDPNLAYQNWFLGILK